nr:hypothetical protein L204_03257 [Cryptococcus depauperatus CBS 7855]
MAGLDIKDCFEEALYYNMILDESDSSGSSSSTVKRIKYLNGSLEEIIRYQDNDGGWKTVLRGAAPYGDFEQMNQYSLCSQRPCTYSGCYRTLEWAVLSYDHKSRAFSAPGDSGAAAVDGLGRICGIITAGAGSTKRMDIAHVKPIGFLLKDIKTCYLNACLISV